MFNKRGQGLSTNAIVLIILAVVVLAVLVIGFTMGWSRIAPWISSEGNVDTIIQQCSVACSTNSVYDYCTRERTLDDGKKEEIGTCSAFAKSGYGVEDCSVSLCEELKNCAPAVAQGGLGGVVKTKTQGCGDNEVIVSSLESSGISICCVPVR